MTAGRSVAAAEPYSSDGALERLGVLASALAGRTLAVRMTEGEPAWTDGRSILLSPEAGGGRHATVIVQAATLAAGSHVVPGLGRAIARAAVRERYTTLEAIRALGLVRDAVPPGLAARVAAVYDGRLSASAEESLRRARSPETIPAPPPWFGTIRPLRGEPVSSGPERLETPSARGSTPDPEREAEDDGPAVFRELLPVALSTKVGRAFKRLRGSSSGEGSQGGTGIEAAIAEAGRRPPGPNGLPVRDRP
ncbi:MAG: hypothetical protein H0V81_13590, partial [Solirubrobacterales bacterium]|nr:hypothetical protein [Solirubrobacterales bacterium]